MKKTLVLLYMMVVFSALSFSQKTEERTLTTFDKLVVSSEVRVFLTKGSEEKVKIVATGIDPSEVETIIKEKTLEIQLKRGIFVDVTVELFLTYNEIQEISVDASGRISLQNPILGDKLLLNASSSGEFVAELNLRKVDIRVGQGATVRISGKTGYIDAKVSTGGILSALDLQSDSTYVRVNSAGNAKVNAMMLLDANVKTGGTLTYKGNPKVCNVKTGIGASVNVLE